jgi:electron transfer flavoprotein alpha subunit
MKVIAVIELAEGKIKKSSYEAAYYAARAAAQMNMPCIAIALGQSTDTELAGLGAFGVSEVLHVADARFDTFDSRAHTKAIAQAATQHEASMVIVSFSPNGKLLAPRLSVRLKAGYVPGANELPTGDASAIQVVKNVFSGKAKATYSITTACKVIAVSPNSLSPVKGEGTATVTGYAADMASGDFTTVSKSMDKVTGAIALSDADIVVSAGRGLKGPENWGMIEELAHEMGAATACSRPVSDVDWRPHHEHVGQTGLTVKPNLYLAIGISGAIQHLAGVNQSKVIVVVNTDAECPFFKAADYGVVGDAFQVVPKLIESYKKFKAAAH